MEIPLATLGFGGYFESHDPGPSGIQVLHEAAYRPAFSSRVSAFKYDDHFFTGGLNPVLHLDQFDLKRKFLIVVFLQLHALGVRVSPGQK